MLVLRRTNSENNDFIALVAALDKDLSIRDGEDHAYYHQFNSIAGLPHTVVAYWHNEPVGCGAIKNHNSNSVEVKRMYVTPNARGKNIATEILKELEHWAKELHYRHCILETGKKQPEAIALYKKNGYLVIPNYGPYRGIANSICFRKDVS